jgi:hypothetical protein
MVKGKNPLVIASEKNEGERKERNQHERENFCARETKRTVNIYKHTFFIIVVTSQ